MIASTSRPEMSRTQPPVSFRLTDREVAELDSEAERRGLGRNECARELLRFVLKQLKSPDVAEDLRRSLERLLERAEENATLLSRMEEMVSDMLAVVAGMRVGPDKPPSEALDQAVQLLREELAVSVLTLLVHAGKSSQESALKWVKQNLGGQP